MKADLDRLFETARRERVDTAPVELGFETRLMARLREERAAAAPWAAWAWRLCPLFAAIVIALSAWNFFALRGSPADLQAAILAGDEQEFLISRLAGD